MPLNPELIKLARRTVGRSKVAFQPPGGGGDPSQDPAAAGGMPPGADPAAAGGMPPGMDPAAAGGMPPGAPPMDPAAAGGAPPMDPSMMAPPPADPSAGGGGPGMADVLAKLDQLSQAMQMAPQNQAGPGGAPGGPGKPGKPDLLAMSMDIFQIKKMFSALFDAMGIPMPQDILDGPNRDPATGAPMPPGTPGSTSDPARQSPPAGAAAGGGAGGGASAPNSAIKPIGQMQGAFPAGGGEKSGAVRMGEEAPAAPNARAISNKAAALSTVLRRRMKG